MNLRALALQPGELGQGRRRLDPGEAEQLEQLGRAFDLGRRDLDPDVVEHQSNNEPSAARTTIAVDQVTASAVIWLSRP